VLLTNNAVAGDHVTVIYARGCVNDAPAVDHEMCKRMGVSERTKNGCVKAGTDQGEQCSRTKLIEQCSRTMLTNTRCPDRNVFSETFSVLQL
jgi:hypothetical protein